MHHVCMRSGPHRVGPIESLINPRRRIKGGDESNMVAAMKAAAKAVARARGRMVVETEEGGLAAVKVVAMIWQRSR